MNIVVVTDGSVVLVWILMCWFSGISLVLENLNIPGKSRDLTPR
jgi:hypothetical protein